MLLTPLTFVHSEDESPARDAADETIAQLRTRLSSSDDPGAIAEHRAAAAWMAEDFVNAENDYRRVLADDALPPERRARAWHNLGVTLVRRSQGTQADPLRAAITCFQNARDDAAATDELRQSAMFNLELAKRLWNRAQIEQANPPTPDAKSPTEATLPEVNPSTAGTSDQNTPPPMANNQPPRSKNDPNATGPRAEGDAQSIDRPPSPGAGNLPVLVDTATLTPLTPDQVAGLLQQDADRLQRERRSQSQSQPMQRAHPYGW